MSKIYYFQVQRMFRANPISLEMSLPQYTLIETEHNEISVSWYQDAILTEEEVLIIELSMRDKIRRLHENRDEYAVYIMHDTVNEIIKFLQNLRPIIS